jgi:putative transcription factor
MTTNFQDWTTVSWDKRGERSKNESKTDYINNQQRKGNVVSHVKSQSLNQNPLGIVTNTRKIAAEEETFKHPTVSLNMSKKIAQARCEKKMTQKELANALSLPFKIIQDYEAGKAIPNAVILNKIEKALGVRVRD